MLAILFVCFAVTINAAVVVKKPISLHLPSPLITPGFDGCPYNNDFYYNGTVASPYFPQNYHRNVKCWYYMYAARGNVLKYNFTHFDLAPEDYLSIYDGYGEIAPLLEQIGGSNGTVQTPAAVYYTKTRWALVTFLSQPTSMPRSGFSFNYESVSTASPCNRDILLVINGLASVGTQANFVKQLNYIANDLISSWSIGLDQVRVSINLQVASYYALVYRTTDVPDMATLKETILGLAEYVPDVTENTDSDFESLFHYAEDDGTEEFDDREGIERVAIVFVAQNPTDSQDYYAAVEFAHDTRTKDDTKLITVAMGQGIDVEKVGRLSFGNGFYFGADYNNLNTLTAAINTAICKTEPVGCGV